MPKIDLTDESLSRRERARLRHRWEQPLYFIAATTSVIVAVAAVIAWSAQFWFPQDWASISVDDKNLIYLVLGLIILGPVTLLIYRRMQIAKEKMSGVIVSPTQLSYVYELLEYYCKLAGVKHIPTVVVVAGAKPSSMTSAGWRKHTITLNNLLVEVKTSDGDRQALRFALAREIGHISAGHRTLRRQLLTLVTQSIPYISNLLYYAEEYTADRWAALLAPDCAATYFGVEATGKFLWADIDIHEVSSRAGSGGILETAATYLMSIPPITWRVNAIAKTGIFEIFSADSLKQDEVDPALQQICQDLKIGKRLTLDSLSLKSSHGAFWMPPKPTSY